MNRIEQQLDLFASVNGSYKITKPLRLIEMFSGIGAQSKALEVLGIPFENWKTCEWAYNSICGYNAIHTKDKTDYSKDLTKQELIDYLQGNISTNYDEPCDVSKKPETWLRNCYNNVKATHDLMNICNVKGQDLEIDTNYHHIVSWSYPCQDLSAAGLGAGMKEGSGTRSSLCFEFLRIIKELTQEQRQATTLIMENVQQAVGSKNVYDFQQVEKELADLGYTNHIKILNLKDYGIPQNRERVFMVSCFGDYEFPAKVQLKYLLRDLLNRNVDEKYYLSDEAIDRISNWEAQQDPLKDIDKPKECCPCLTARGAGEEHSGMVLINEEAYLGTYNYVKSDNFMKGNDRFQKGKNISDTILASGNNNGVVINENIKNKK